MRAIVAISSVIMRALHHFDDIFNCFNSEIASRQEGEWNHFAIEWFSSLLLDDNHFQAILSRTLRPLRISCWNSNFTIQFNLAGKTLSFGISSEQMKFRLVDGLACATRCLLGAVTSMHWLRVGEFIKFTFHICAQQLAYCGFFLHRWIHHVLINSPNM